jgi:tetratricopeptide (TPR) repeat protein
MTVIERRNDSLETLRAAMNPPTAEALDRVTAFRTRLDTDATTLEPYLSAHEQAASEMSMLVEAAATLETGGYESFRRSTMQLLSRNNYDDYQMRQTLALLVRLLVDPEAPSYDGMQPDSLHLSRTEAEAFASYRNELESYGWMPEFENMLRVVNTNLAEHDVVFQEEVMRNLRLQRPGAPEPYYELAELFNVAGEGDPDAVRSALNDALAKITDPVLLDNVQRWHMRVGDAPLAVDERAQSTIDEGLAQFEAGNLEAARQTMLRASRLAGASPLVPYYQGQIAQAQGEFDTAILYFERAREQAPAYLPPALQAIDTHIQAEAYDRAVAQADSVLTDQPYWLVYYQKAKALMGAERYAEAQSVIQSRCEPLNDEDPNLYLTLGDIYMGQEQWDGARWAYEEAGRINPENPDFTARMDSLRTTLNERGIDFSEVQPETETIEVSAPPE